MLTFPHSARVFLRFRHSDTGLTPSFTYYKRADTLVGVAPPVINEVGGGTYYFDHVFATSTDPDIVFEVDGGGSIPTEEVRYISDTISVRDHFIDEPVSQVHDDVWGDTDARAEGTKGRHVDDIGLVGDTSAVASVFGRMVLSRETLMGTSSIDLTEVYDRIGAPVGASISADIASAITSIKGASNRDLSQVYTLVGTVDGKADTIINNVATVDGVVDAIKLKTDLIQGATLTTTDLTSALTNLSTMLARAMGMLHENSVLDRCTYDPTTNNLLSGRLRLYDSSATAQAAKAAGEGADYPTGMIGQYSIVCEYSGDNMTNYLVVREYPA